MDPATQVAAKVGWARRRARLPGCADLVVSVLPPRLALTFDDGPDPTGTPAVLDALGTAPGTFFVLVDRTESQPGLVREIVDRGNRIGLHGDRHDRVDLVPAHLLAIRLRDAARRLEDVSGQEVRLFRPPYGRASWRTFLATRRAGLQLALWSHDPRDWEPGASDRIALCMVPGAIVLLHDGSLEQSGQVATTAACVARLLPDAVRRGLRPVSL